MLVIEDNDDLRLMYAETLAQLGYQTAGASDGASGVEAAFRLRPSAVLMDFAMPGLDGLAATRVLRADPRTTGCRIVLVTGRGMSVCEEAHAAGCDAFLCKPFAAPALEQALGRMQAPAPAALPSAPLTNSIKLCDCGRDFTRKTWLTLRLCGRMRHPVENAIYELRTCPCGSTLAVMLDRAGQSGERSRAAAPVARAPAVERGTVFVVDRDTSTRALVQQFVRDDYDVVFFDDGESALTAVRKSTPSAVVTEILIPKIDGLSLCRMLKGDSEARAVPILVFSVLDACERARQAGADGFLEKPLERASLLASLHALTDPRDRAA